MAAHRRQIGRSRRQPTTPGILVLISATTLRIGTVDWAVLVILAFEVPSLLFSQYPSNSVHASEAVAVAVMVYFGVWVMIRKPVHASWLAGLVGVGGLWLAFSGIRQFVIGTQPLAEVGLTDFVAFRSRLIHPIRGWVPGKDFTVFLLALPFACAAACYFWLNGSPRGKTNAGQAVLALLPVVVIVAAPSLSL